MRFLIAQLILMFGMFYATGYAESQSMRGPAENVWFRYNKVGYPSKGVKRILIISKNDLNSKEWKIDQPMLTGRLANFLSGADAFLPRGLKAYEISLDALVCNQPQACQYTLKVQGLPDLSFKVYPSGKYPYDTLIAEILKHFKIHRSGLALPDFHLAAGHQQDAKAAVFQTQKTGPLKSCQENNKNRLNPEWTDLPACRVPNGCDLGGGWYDAGDYIKFTQTIAYATYVMLRALEVSENNSSLANVNKQLREEAEFGLKYLMKTTPGNNSFIIQVGDESDHDYENQTLRPLPSNDSRSRRAYSVLSPPQMTLAIAALALGGRVFNNRSYALQAKKINDLRRNSASSWLIETDEDCQTNENDFYKDENFQDNIRLSTIELEQVLPNYDISDSNIDYESSEILALMKKADPKKLQEMIQYDYVNKISESPDNVWKIPTGKDYQRLYPLFGPAFVTAQKGRPDQQPIVHHVLNYLFGLNNWGVSFMNTSLCIDCNEGGFITYDAIYPKINEKGRGEIYQGGLPPSWGECADSEEAKCHKLAEGIFDTPEVAFYYHHQNHQTIETSIWGETLAIAFLAAAAELDR